jgi:protein-arginine kinase activator protein McsA
MTDKEMDDLATRVATKVVKAIFNVSSEVHLVFENQIENQGFIVQNKDDLDKQELVLELMRLQSLLKRYEEEEKYEKAQIIKRKIQILKTKYDKLN